MVYKTFGRLKICRIYYPLGTQPIHGANESIVKSELQTSEIEHWVKKNSQNTSIGHNPKFALVSSNLYFNIGISARKRGEIRTALSAFYKIKNLNRKLKFLICLFLPLHILNRKFH